MVLGGIVVIVVRAAVPSDNVPPSLSPTPEIAPATHAAEPRRPGRLLRAVGRVQPSDRLIAWGVVLLVIAATVAGMISVNVGITTTGR